MLHQNKAFCIITVQSLLYVCVCVWKSVFTRASIYLWAIPRLVMVYMALPSTPGWGIERTCSFPSKCILAAWWRPQCSCYPWTVCRGDSPVLSVPLKDHPQPEKEVCVDSSGFTFSNCFLERSHCWCLYEIWIIHFPWFIVAGGDPHLHPFTDPAIVNHKHLSRKRAPDKNREDCGTQRDPLLLPVFTPVDLSLWQFQNNSLLHLRIFDLDISKCGWHCSHWPAWTLQSPKRPS